MRHILSVFSLCVILAAVSCKPAAASPVAAQLSRGQAIYEQGCALQACHGAKGEGIRKADAYSSWPLVGEEFQQRNPTAQVIFDVVRSGGETSLRALSDQQVYDSIAYELSLNGVVFSEPLEVDNAPFITSGAAAALPRPGSLFPPPGNARLIPNWSAPALPVFAENSLLRLRLTQIALAASIGSSAPPDGGRYALVVFTLEVLAGQPLDVGPQHLRLATGAGQLLEPVAIGLDYPVARFYAHTIQPEHGTAALAVFALPGTANIVDLRYILPADDVLVLKLFQKQ